MTDLDTDPRWRRLLTRETNCDGCGQPHKGVFDIGYDHPDAWPHGNLAETGQPTMEVGRDFLGRDICEVGDARFVRCLMPLPIIGTDTQFAFGPWGSLHPDRFEDYLDAEEGKGTFDQAFSWLGNDLPGVDTDGGVPCTLVANENPDHRPLLWANSDHSLGQLQREGITFDQLLDIYAAFGHDLRPALSDG